MKRLINLIELKILKWIIIPYLKYLGITSSNMTRRITGDYVFTDYVGNIWLLKVTGDESYPLQISLLDRV